MQYDIAIIGGGAAGLACAVRLVKSGAKCKIAIFEGSDRVGRKIAATGNGQGNVSNFNMSPEHYFGGNSSLAGRIACGNKKVYEEIFTCLFQTDAVGRVYPSGRQASALCDDLIRTLSGKAEIYLSKVVTKIADGFKIETQDGGSYSARFVVLCTGGFAQPVLKTYSPYALAESAGHTLKPLYPSLVQLKTSTEHIKTLKGIRADCTVSAIIGGKVVKKVRGDVIFTEYGVSGNAVFSVSPYITDKSDAIISIEFLPDFTSEQIEKSLLARKGNVLDSELLSGTLHNQIGRAIIKRAGSSDCKKIAELVKNFTLPITGTLGFGYAQVTRGGINMGEITEELESKKKKNMFFAGEVVDVDGDCGGYNLHWAFTSGIFVAENVLKRL